MHIEASSTLATKGSFTIPNTILNGSFLFNGIDTSLTISPLVSDQLNYIMTIVNYVVLCTGVSLFGIATNTINILVFLRQGFKETITISFLGMAISDLLLQVMTLWVSVSSNPWLQNANIPFKGLDLFFFLGAWIQITATRITSWITAFVTLERCLCVIMPLKIKNIITTLRTKVIVVTIFFVYIIGLIPNYFTIEIRWVFDKGQNRSLLNMIELGSKKSIQNFMHYFYNVVSPIASFIVVFICTLILSMSINRSSKWRSKLSNKDENSKMKEQRVIKLVTAIASVYVICNTPTIGLFIWQIKDPEASYVGIRRDLLLLLASFAFLLESVNSSINIIFYYTMSSKYRETLKTLLKC